MKSLPFRFYSVTLLCCASPPSETIAFLKQPFQQQMENLEQHLNYIRCQAINSDCQPPPNVRIKPGSPAYRGLAKDLKVLLVVNTLGYSWDSYIEQQSGNLFKYLGILFFKYGLWAFYFSKQAFQHTSMLPQRPSIHVASIFPHRRQAPTIHRSIQRLQVKK